jgi:hypothetical protein
LELLAQPSIGFDYDYDGNIQRGGSSAGTNAPFTAVALGSGAQYVVTTGSITRSTANVINFVALERNYLHNLKFKFKIKKRKIIFLFYINKKIYYYGNSSIYNRLI